MVSVSPAKSHADGGRRPEGPMGSLPDLGEPRLGRDKILISKVAETGRGSRVQPEPDAGRRQTPGTALKPPWRGHQVERTGIVFFTSLLLCIQVISLSSNPTGELFTIAILQVRKLRHGAPGTC